MTEKTAVVAPTPRAREMMAVSANAGRLRSSRREWRRSDSIFNLVCVTDCWLVVGSVGLNWGCLQEGCESRRAYVVMSCGDVASKPRDLGTDRGYRAADQSCGHWGAAVLRPYSIEAG